MSSAAAPHEHPEVLTEGDIDRMTAQDLYDMGPASVEALSSDGAVARDAALAEYLREVAAGYESPLCAPDAYAPAFVAGLSVDQMQEPLGLQATRARRAVLAARRRMPSPPRLRSQLPGIYPVAMAGESYGPPPAALE